MKINKIFTLLLICLMTVSIMCACNNDSSSDQSSKRSNKSSQDSDQVSTPPMITEQIIESLTKEFLKKSFDEQFSNWNFNTFEISTNSYQELDERIEIKAEINAINDTFSFYETYTCTYEPAGNDWKIADCQVSQSRFQLLSSSITQATADSKLLATYPEIATFSPKGHNIDSERKTDTYIYQVLVEDGYKTIEYTSSIVYRFDFRTGWTYDSCYSYETGFAWNIEGIWSYHSSSSDATITIHKVEGNTLKVEYDYCLFYKTPFDYTRESGKSSRVETVALQSSGNNLYFILGDEHFYLDQYIGISVANEALIFSHDSGNGYDVPSQHFFPYSYNLRTTYAISYTNGGLGGRNEYDYAGDWLPYGGFGHTGGDSSRATETYELYGAYRSLCGTLYLGRGSTIGTSAVARIYGDGELLYEFDAANFTENNYDHKFFVDVTGVRELTIDLPGNYTIHSTGWPGINWKDAVLSLTDVIVTKGSAYDAVSLQLPDSKQINTFPLSKSCFAFAGQTGIRPIFVALDYNEQYFKLDHNYNYVFNEEAVLSCAKDIYNKYSVDNDKCFIVIYFADGITPGSQSEYFYIYVPKELKEIYDSTSILYSLISNTRNDEENYVSRVATALTEYRQWLSNS